MKRSKLPEGDDVPQSKKATQTGYASVPDTGYASQGFWERRYGEDASPFEW